MQLDSRHLQLAGAAAEGAMGDIEQIAQTGGSAADQDNTAADLAGWHPARAEQIAEAPAGEAVQLTEGQQLLVTSGIEPGVPAGRGFEPRPRRPTGLEFSS